MRDERYTTETVTRYFSNTGGGGIASTQNATHISLWQGRSDAVSTEPTAQGAYFRPTTYRGYFYRGTSRAYDHRAGSILSTAQSARRYWGRCSFASYSAGLMTSSIYGCTANGSPSVPGSLISRVESRILGQIRSNSWNLGQSLAEAPESVRFIVDLMKRLLAALKAARRLAWRAVATALGVRPLRDRNTPFPMHRASFRARSIRKRGGRLRRFKDAASGWLAYQYGWLPLLNDIYSAANAISNGLKDPSSFSAFVDESEPLPAPTPVSSIKDMGTRFTGKRGCKVKVVYRVDHPELFDLSRLGLMNPLALAWELLPLSFIVDWFFPIGNFLSALEQPIGLNFSHGFRTVYTKWSLTATFAFDHRFWGGTPASVQGYLFSFSRSQYIGFPIPVPHFRGFGQLGEDFSKTLSLIALAVQKY